MSTSRRSPIAVAVGESLRLIRERAGLSVREVSRRMETHHTAVTRTEEGRRRLSTDDIAAWLAHLGATADERAAVLALVRDVGRSAWSAVGHAVPAQLSTLVRYEREAVAITEVNAVLIPGLLQTENYVRAVMSTGDIPDDGIEDRVIYRMGRQSVLRRRAGAMTAIIDEGALTRQIGGHAVMAEQMTALLDWSNTGHVEVLIIPTSIGAHRGMAGGFMILDMPDGVVVHLEHLDSGVFLHEPADTRSFVEAASSLQDVAMSPVDSARLIATYADSHARNEASP